MPTPAYPLAAARFAALFAESFSAEMVLVDDDDGLGPCLTADCDGWLCETTGADGAGTAAVATTVEVEESLAGA